MGTDSTTSVCGDAGCPTLPDAPAHGSAYCPDATIPVTYSLTYGGDASPRVELTCPGHHVIAPDSDPELTLADLVQVERRRS